MFLDIFKTFFLLFNNIYLCYKCVTIFNLFAKKIRSDICRTMKHYKISFCHTPWRFFLDFFLFVCHRKYPIVLFTFDVKYVCEILSGKLDFGKLRGTFSLKPGIVMTNFSQILTNTFQTIFFTYLINVLAFKRRNY